MQIHLHAKKDASDWLYEIDPEFLKDVLSETSASGIDLEVLPFRFDKEAIYRLLDLGIRWYATDEPAKFIDCVNSLLHTEEIGTIDG